MRRSAVVLIALGAVLGTRASPAQDQLWEQVGIRDKLHVGTWLRSAGDVDRDGYEDVFVQVHFEFGVTEMWLLSGRDGTTRKTLKQPDPWRIFQNIEGLPDMDGDGTVDYAIARGDTGWQARPKTVEILSGKSDRLIWKVELPWGTWFGSSILGDVELDGDGKPDVVIAAEYERDANDRWIGGVYAYSNAGKLLHVLRGNSSRNLHIGLSLAKAGDVDRDGRDDYVVGTSAGTSNGFGQAMLVSGRTGKVIVHGTDPRQQGMVGQEVTGLGDIDGDGVPDFGASGGGVGVPQAVRAFSGRTGKVLWESREPGTTEAISRVRHDFDRDGIADIVQGAPGARNGMLIGGVHVLSGRTGEVLVRLASRETYQADMGVQVLALRPPPGGRFPMLAFIEPRLGHGGKVTYLGRVAVHHGEPSGVRIFGTACHGPGRAESPAIGIRPIASGTRIHLSGAAEGAPALLFLGTSNTMFGPFRLPLPLDRFGLTACSLLTSSELGLASATGSSGNGRGYARIDLSLQLAAKGALTLHGQWLSLGTNGRDWGFSDAVTARF